MLITKQKTNIKVAVGLKDCKYMNIQYIYDLYAMATEEEKQTDWYVDAYHFATDLSEKYDISPVKVALLISAISPQQKWEKNKVKQYNTIYKTICKYKNSLYKNIKENKRKKDSFIILM